MKVCDIEITHDVYKLLRSFKHPSHLLVCDGDEMQGVDKGDADEVVPMHLRAADFMPGS